MKNLNPYLAFAGTCEEALKFYKESLGGDIVYLQTYGQSPVDAPDEQKGKVMHAEFKGDGVHFMACDVMGGNELKIGNNISMSLNFTDESEQETVFNKLSAGGAVSMPLQDTFWGAKFGMFTDKYGVSWLVNCQKNNEQQPQ